MQEVDRHLARINRVRGLIRGDISGKTLSADEKEEIVYRSLGWETPVDGSDRWLVPPEPGTPKYDWGRKMRWRRARPWFGFRFSNAVPTYMSDLNLVKALVKDLFFSERKEHWNQLRLLESEGLTGGGLVAWEACIDASAIARTQAYLRMIRVMRPKEWGHLPSDI